MHEDSCNRPALIGSCPYADILKAELATLREQRDSLLKALVRIDHEAERIFRSRENSTDDFGVIPFVTVVINELHIDLVDEIRSPGRLKKVRGE